MAETDAVTGGCLCGAVRYDIHAAPLGSRVCWCRLCQHIAGNGTVNVVFPRDAVRVQGETRDFVSTADSGTLMHRRFCPTCGVHLFSEAQTRPNLIIVRAGTLDDPQLAPPTATIWCGSAPAWACIDPRLPRIDGQPA